MHNRDHGEWRCVVIVYDIMLLLGSHVNLLLDAAGVDVPMQHILTNSESKRQNNVSFCSILLQNCTNKLEIWDSSVLLKLFGFNLGDGSW